MFIYIKSSMGNYSIQNLNGNNTIKDLKEEIKKKMKVNVPIIKLRLRNNSGKTLLDDKSLSQSNVSDNTTLILDVKMGAFGEMKKPEIELSPSRPQALAAIPCISTGLNAIPRLNLSNDDGIAWLLRRVGWNPGLISGDDFERGAPAPACL